MKNKIVNIIIFAVAILDCILALVFSMNFNEDKKDNFFQARQIQAQCPALIADLQTATPENLPTVVEKYQKSLRTFNDSLNDVQLQKDILYTYLQDLKNLDEKSFEQYKSDFANRAEGLFAKCDNKQAYVDGFKGVNSFKDLEAYINKLEKEYSVLKQDYLVNRDYCKAANSLVSRADMINGTASANKKAADLEELQNDLKGFASSSKLENAFMFVGYFLGLIAILLLLFFAVMRIIKNFKTSYKILVVLALFAIVVFIGYLVGSPVLTPSAMKFGMTSTGFKMVNAACFTLYVCLICAILAIIVTSIISAVKNRK